MAAAHTVTVGNGYLAERARSAGAGRVEFIPTVIDLDRYPETPPEDRAGGPPRVVWIGSPSSCRYLNLLRDPLMQLRKRIEFKLRIIGGTAPDLPGVDIEAVPWSEETEVASLRECQIGVMPLFDSPWERGKCGYKLIQYMACGLPVVASPVGVNREIVRAGENGLLAGTTGEWVEVLDRLLANRDLRHEMGRAGRKRVEEEYCTQRVAPRLLELLTAAARRSVAAGFSADDRAEKERAPCAE
jgi:glycosyltransferase involved in cell wall biosynthesis